MGDGDNHWHHTVNQKCPPPHPRSITRKKGLVLFLNHRKNCCSLEGTLSRQTYQISRWHSGVVLFFLKVSLCKTRAFTWCTMWSHHLPRNNIAERHGTKRTLNRQFWIQGSLISWLCLTVFSNNEVGQVEVSGSPCWWCFSVSTWASLASRKSNP